MIPIHLAPHHVDGTEIPTSLRGTCKLGTASRVNYPHEFSHKFFPLLLACWLAGCHRSTTFIAAGNTSEQVHRSKIKQGYY